MILRCLFFMLLIWGLAPSAHATDAPEIALRGDDGLGQFVTSGLILEDLNVKIDIQSGLAQIAVTATLRNETEDDVEASFAYPLPSGAVINGYALDIDGALVDGVIMPKERAEALYTDRVTAAVDPGIAARTADNRYRTRIYPILADGGRRSVRLDFTAPVPAHGLRLSLSQAAEVERVSIQISGEGASQAQTPIQGETAENIVLSGGIFIPAAPAAASLSHYAGQTFLTLPLARPEPQPQSAVKSVAVIWDTSLSRKTQASSAAAERHFIFNILAALEPDTQILIYGGDRIESAVPYEKPIRFSAALTGLTYDGATDFSALLDADVFSRKNIDPDICVLISDGRSTLGPGGIPNLPCRVFTFSADKNPNTDYLSLLASRNNGADLSGLDASEAARLISGDGGYQLGPNQEGGIFIAGNRHWLILPVGDTLKRIKIQYLDNTQDINLRSLSATRHRSASSLWGQRRMAELRAKGPSSFDGIVEISRRYGVQGTETAFLVLESAEDYIEAKIDPPENFPVALMQNYKIDLAKAQREETENQIEHVKSVLAAWEDQVEWWKTDWAKLARDEAEKNRERSEALLAAVPPPPSASAPALARLADFTCWDGTPAQNAGGCPVQALIAQDTAEPEPAVEPAPQDGFSDESDEIIVTGARRINPAGTLPSEISVSVREWSPDRPFLKVLADLGSGAFEVEYRRWRNTHGDRASFYLEIADQLHSNGRTERAAKMAATALELPSATMITRANVADRLLMYGRTQMAISLYREILPTAKDRPQPYYNLALALIQAGDKSQGNAQLLHYREAFEHLIHVINNEWEDDYDGIHLIALQDLNRTLARLPKKTRRKVQRELGLNKAFYRNLDVDIRVIVDWTSDDADMDIHVIERVGADDEEEAFYSNDATIMGGRISNDMTEGYGPEEYLIRRAPDGLYRVTSDYYAQDAYSEDGALKLRARIWRNYGRPTEIQDTVIIEMLEEKEDDYILGEIQIGATIAETGNTD